MDVLTSPPPPPSPPHYVLSKIHLAREIAIRERYPIRDSFFSRRIRTSTCTAISRTRLGKRETRETSFPRLCSLSRLFRVSFLLCSFPLFSFEYGRISGYRQFGTTSKRATRFRLRCTGAPAVSANVLQWAPSRVTRRGALAATAAAAVAAFSPPLLRHLPPAPPVSLRANTRARPPSPLLGRPMVVLVPRASRHADIPTTRPHGRVAGSLLLHKIHLCSVPFTLRCNG